jgi:cytochrome P450
MSCQEPGACPAAAGFDPFDPAYLADPYPVLSAVRQETPVFHAPALGMWVVTRYADIEAVLGDPATFSAAIAQSPLVPPSEAALAELGEDFPPPPTMSNCDPPEHARIRRVNMRTFSARRTAVLEPRVRAAATGMVDRMLTSPRFDVVAGLTYPLPAFMIFTLIGFPEADTELIKSWCGDRMNFSWGRPDPEEQVQIARDMHAYWGYCKEFVAERLARPRDDLASDLLRTSREDPGQLSVLEATAIVYGLSFAGHETTSNLTTNAIRRLLEHRDQWEALCADPGLIPGAVEETLRYDTSVVSWRRVTTRPVTLGGVDLPAGTRLMLLLASANRDPDRFDDPDTFDVTRADAVHHLSLGRGIHFCLGAPLARMEVGIVLELLTTRAPDLELVPDQALSFPPNISFRGPRQLWLQHGGG